MLRSIVSFDEFSPEPRLDVKVILFRWLFLLLLFGAPVVLTLLWALYQIAPVIIYMMGGLSALYVPVLLLIRPARVTLTQDFHIQICKSRVDTSLLVKSAGAATVYFVLLSFSVFLLAR